MNIQQVEKILNDEGKKVCYEKGKIKEEVFPYENYYELEELVNCWQFNLVLIEKRNNAEYECLANFSSENQAARFFLLQQLSLIFSSKASSFIDENEQYLFKDDLIELANIKDTMIKNRVPLTYLSYRNKQENSILIKEQQVGCWYTSYIDANGDINYTSKIPIEKEECLESAFIDIYSLFLLDKLAQKNIKNGILDRKFNSNEIAYFLGYKTLEESIKEDSNLK
ncbi:hypothetical protein KPL40_19320 [Clostridium gasigenes]|uniref:hypothetical protein n=1 Tax=Clostridium gasigenes TaxID=94869 RepID=UPI001C0D192B|nr:hypothetical protein [Clostridium gasigenes]MBU3134562.1 hypothetical protein [Clostridium gasigenes]